MCARPIQVRESSVEDVLALFPQVMAQLLGINTQLSLIGRQMVLPSGKLDLLFLGGKELFLIELKVEDYRQGFLNQVQRYWIDLQNLQAAEQLIQGQINPFLLCPYASPSAFSQCQTAGVKLQIYAPDEILTNFLNRISSLSNLLRLRPMDYGVWNIHLINRVLYSLDGGSTSASLSSQLGLSGLDPVWWTPDD